MTDTAPKDPTPAWSLTFLTDAWEWDRQLTADTLDAAKAQAREALEQLVAEERPQLACVTLIKDDRKFGVWDWVAGQPYWSRV